MWHEAWPMWLCQCQLSSSHLASISLIPLCVPPSHISLQVTAELSLVTLANLKNEILIPSSPSHQWEIYEISIIVYSYITAHYQLTPTPTPRYRPHHHRDRETGADWWTWVCPEILTTNLLDTCLSQNTFSVSLISPKGLWASDWFPVLPVWGFIRFLPHLTTRIQWTFRGARRWDAAITLSFAVNDNSYLHTQSIYCYRFRSSLFGGEENC